MSSYANRSAALAGSTDRGHSGPESEEPVAQLHCRPSVVRVVLHDAVEHRVRLCLLAGGQTAGRCRSGRWSRRRLGLPSGLRSGQPFCCRTGSPAVVHDGRIGIRDGAAEGLASRLEMVGVPAVIGAVLGQCAYLPERKRHPSIPAPIVRSSEISYLVDQYVSQLRVTFDPIAKTALVQGLCVRVFGSNAEKVFVAGYPELAPESIASSEGSRTTEERADATEGLLRAAGRYFVAGYDPGAPDVAQVLCTLEQQDEDPIDGVLILMNETLCFFDSTDLVVEDLTDGSPILIDVEDIRSCRLVKSDEISLDNYRFFQVQRWFRDSVFLEIETVKARPKFHINLVSLVPGQRAAVERDPRRVLYVLDRETLCHQS